MTDAAGRLAHSTVACGHARRPCPVSASATAGPRRQPAFPLRCLVCSPGPQRATFGSCARSRGRRQRCETRSGSGTPPSRPSICSLLARPVPPARAGPRGDAALPRASPPRKRSWVALSIVAVVGQGEDLPVEAPEARAGGCRASVPLRPPQHPQPRAAVGVTSPARGAGRPRPDGRPRPGRSLRHRGPGRRRPSRAASSAPRRRRGGCRGSSVHMAPPFQHAPAPARVLLHLCAPGLPPWEWRVL